MDHETLRGIATLLMLLATTFPTTTDDLGATIINALADAVNGGDQKRIVDTATNALRHQHRSLQQGVIGVLKCIIEEYADSQYDIRNENAVYWARDVRALTDSPSCILPGRLPLL